MAEKSELRVAMLRFIGETAAHGARGAHGAHSVWRNSPHNWGRL